MHKMTKQNRRKIGKQLDDLLKKIDTFDDSTMKIETLNDDELTFEHLEVMDNKSVRVNKRLTLTVDYSHVVHLVEYFGGAGDE